MHATNRLHTGLSSSSPESLILELSDKNAQTRVDARTQLIHLGPVAIPHLRAMLSSGDQHTRWEVVKALSEIRHKSSAEALASALTDEDRDVRWSAAEGIILFGEEAFEPLLESIIANSDFVGLRESAAHALAGLKDEKNFEVVSPVLRALHGAAPLFEAPVAAYAALKDLRHRPSR